MISRTSRSWNSTAPATMSSRTIPCRPASSAMALRSSSEWKGSGSAPFWPSRRRRTRDEKVSAETAGPTSRLIHSITGATHRDRVSAWRTARDLGTSSPTTSDR